MAYSYFFFCLPTFSSPKYFCSNNHCLKSILFNHNPSELQKKFNGILHSSKKNGHYFFKFNDFQNVEPIKRPLFERSLIKGISTKYYCTGIHAWLITWPLKYRSLPNQIGIGKKYNFNPRDIHAYNLGNKEGTLGWRLTDGHCYYEGKKVTTMPFNFKKNERFICLLNMDKKSISLHAEDGAHSESVPFTMDKVRLRFQLKTKHSRLNLKYLGNIESTEPASLKTLAGLTAINSLREIKLTEKNESMLLNKHLVYDLKKSNIINL